MNIWMIEKTSMRHHYLKKKDFYSHLNIKNIIDADYMYAKGVSKDFKIKNSG